MPCRHALVFLQHSKHKLFSASINGYRFTSTYGPLSALKTGGLRILNQPGPTVVPDSVLRAQNRQNLLLEDQKLHSMTASIMADLKPMFGCSEDSEIFLHAGNGHGMWDSVLVNTLNPGDKVLVASGFFAENWAFAATGLGLQPELLPSDLAQTVDISAIESRLQADADRQIRAVLLIHADTLTGIVNDIEGVGAALKRVGHDALLVVDSVCSFAVQPMLMEAWGADVVMTASQKGLMCPAGMGIVCAGPRALERHKAVKRPGHGLHSPYWDWTFRLSSFHYFKYCGTPPQHTIFALREALNLLNEEGLDHVLARQKHCTHAVRRAVWAWAASPSSAISLLVQDERWQSSAVVTVIVQEPFSAKLIVDFCKRHFDVEMANCMGPLTNKGFRITTMGCISFPTVVSCLSALEAAFIALDVPHGRGGVPAALEYFAKVAKESGVRPTEESTY